jgi:hypothetical protein
MNKIALAFYSLDFSLMEEIHCSPAITNLLPITTLIANKFRKKW